MVTALCELAALSFVAMTVYDVRRQNGLLATVVEGGRAVSERSAQQREAV